MYFITVCLIEQDILIANNAIMNIRALGLNIKAERNRKDMTQPELAELVDLSTNSISCIEKGKQIPNAINIYRIAKALKIDINDLYKGIE